MNIGKIVLGALVAAAGMTVFADPSVTINKVETASPWVSGEGTITVDYSLSGLDSRYEYRVAFDITAKNETRGVTNDWAKLTEGRQDIKTIDTAALFGKEVVAAEAKVNISLIVEVLPAGRLWKDGPIWAERNLGASKVGDYGELYKYDDADAAVKDILGQEWRLPTKEELNELSKTCESKWDSARGGVTCRGSGKYEVNSIFLPAAGIDQGEGRSEAGSAGVLWSSTPCDVDQAYCLRFAGYIGIAAAEVDEFDRDFGMSVRAVRDGIEGDSEVREEIVATAEAKFWLGPGCECCPWTVGESVTAYIKDRGLYLKGEGEVAETPWAEYDDMLDGIGPLSRAITVPVSVLAKLPISVDGGSDGPSGAIGGAEFEQVQIVDGTAYVGVSVRTNGDLKAERKSWGKVKFDKGVKVDVSADGTELVIPVPANAEQGFMVLESGESK